MEAPVKRMIMAVPLVASFVLGIAGLACLVKIWLNSQSFHNFKDAQDQPAVPYLLVFKTKS